MSKINEQMITEIINLVGGKPNIRTCGNCMTRLRLEVNDTGLVDKDGVKIIAGVLGLIEADGQLQIVLGPGKAQTAAELMRKVLENMDGGQVQAMDLEQIAAAQKKEVKSKQTNPIQKFFATFATIFTPLIPGFIAAGLLLGIGTLIEQYLLNSTGANAFAGTNQELKKLGLALLSNHEFVNSAQASDLVKNSPELVATIINLISYLKIFSVSLFSFMSILIGYNAQKAFGGTGVNGAIIAGFFIFSYVPGTVGKVYAGMESLIGFTIDPRGNIIGVLIAAILGAYIERSVRKWIPDNLDMILTSTITLIIMSILTFFFIMPLGGYLFEGMSWLFQHLNSNPIGAALLAGLFLISVMFGIHQGFIPVYTTLVATQGFNSLFPILAMAGAGQVGAALALYYKANKNSVLRNQIKGAIIPGILGIGEPLIYGVTLPRVKPFITACLGGATGGFFIGLIAYLGVPMGLNSPFGPSGIIALPFMTTGTSVVTGMLIYGAGLIVSYTAGFIITLAFGSKNVDLS